MKGCLTELVIGMGILGIMALVANIYGFPGGNGLVQEVNTVMPGLVILGMLVLISAGFLVRSAGRAESAGVPGAGCGYYLVVIALIIVVIGFFIVGTIATLGG